MRCSKPIYIDGQQLNCGKCRACRVNKAREWSTRMIHEAENWDASMFVTLTYNDENLPFEISKDEAQKFLKRLRKRLEPRRIKFYLGAEYGEKNLRPHYHAIIFGMQACDQCRVCNDKARRNLKTPEEGTDCWTLEQAWNKGYVHGGTVTPQSTRYVADYIQKDTRTEIYGGRTAPFSLKSAGIGKTWADKLDLATCSRGLNAGTKRQPVPRYYQNKVMQSYGHLEEQAKWIITQGKLRYARRSREKLHEFWMERDHRIALGHRIIGANTQAERDLAAYQALRSQPL